MQGKSLYAILLSIIAVLALALAVLVIFLLTTYNNIKPTGNETPTPGPTEARTVPANEQAKINIYAAADGTGGDAIFNLKPSPAHPDNFLMASVTIVIDAGTKSEKLGDRTALTNQYQSEFKQACIEYFIKMTYEDISETDAIAKARDTLKDNFSSILESATKDKIIIKVVIDNWIKQ